MYDQGNCSIIRLRLDWKLLVKGNLLSYAYPNALVLSFSSSGVEMYFVLVVNFFRFCLINFVCIDVAICDSVHDVETEMNYHNCPKFSDR